MANFKILRNRTDCKKNLHINRAIDTLNKIFNNKNTILHYKNPFTLSQIEQEVDVAGLINIFNNTCVMDEPIHLGINTHILISHHQHKKLLPLISEMYTNTKSIIKQTQIINLGYDMSLHEHEIVHTQTESYTKTYSLTINFYKTTI